MDYILPETNLIQIKTMEKLGNNGIFVIEPLSPGYGVTVGNSLRRVLLSSLEGSAITSVKIEGVTHEFSTLPAIREDVVEIILNLKGLRFIMPGSDPVSLKISVKGPKEVTAADFNQNPACAVVNKDTYIASLGKSAKLNLEVLVEKGRGYVPIEKRRDEKLPLGTVAIDSTFTPVKKIHYEVENTRVGGQTDFDKLTLEISTDGSIDPEIALQRAAQILVEHFDLVQKAFEQEVSQKPIKKIAKKANKKAVKTTKTKKPSKK